jgi:hypothetical protein
VNPSKLDWTSYKQNLLNLREYPGGVEILESLTILATLSSVDNLSDLPIALQTLQESELVAFYEGEADSRIPVPGVIRPEVLNAIARLGEIGSLISSHSEQPDPVKRWATLARATVALDTLESEELASWVTPERGILQQIIRQWRQLLLKETAATAPTLV